MDMNGKRTLYELHIHEIDVANISKEYNLWYIEFRSYNQKNVTYRSKQIPSYCYFNRKMFYPLNTFHIFHI